jgi:hypothetical protein
MEAEKNKVGRPKIQLSDLPDGWVNSLVELCEEGGSDVEMRDLLGISESTWNRLIEEEEEFSRTVLRAREKCHVWWIKHSRKELHNKDFNNKLYEMNMQNRFGWNKKVEGTTGKGGFVIEIIDGDKD